MADEVPVEVLEQRAPNKRRLIISGVLGVVVMVAIFAVLYPQLGNYESALSELRDMPSGWVAALIIAGIANILVYPFTVVIAVPGLGYRHGFIQRQSGFLISNVIPGGGAFAVGTQYSILARYGVSSPVAAAAVAADAIWTYLLTLGLPAIAVVLLVVEGRSTAGYTTMAIVGMAIVIVSVIAIAMILRSDAGARRVGGFATRIVNWLLARIKRPPRDLTPSLVRFGSEARGLVQRRWLLLTITNLAAQLMPLAVLLCALGGVGAWPDRVSLVEVFAAYTIALILTSFPITPGGLGTVDAALIGLLVAFGATGSEALVVDLLWRLVWFLPQLLVGAVTMGIYLVESRRARAAAPAPTP